MCGVCVCMCAQHSGVCSGPVCDCVSTQEFVPFTHKLHCRSEYEEQREMRQRQNGGPEREREVVWKADRFEEKHNAEAAQESWNREIS